LLPATMRVAEHDIACTAPFDCGGPETTYAGENASGAAASLSVSDGSNNPMGSGLSGCENGGAIEVHTPLLQTLANFARPG
jgi:hypothetical protein